MILKSGKAGFPHCFTVTGPLVLAKINTTERALLGPFGPKENHVFGQIVGQARGSELENAENSVIFGIFG